MRIIHVLRKPLSEKTVAANTLKHGTGALNIDACRISYGSDADKRSATPQGACTAKVGALAGGTQNERSRTEFIRPVQKGRWPANVILQHLDRCRCDGVKTAGSGRFVAHDAVVRKSTMMDPGKGWNGNSLDNSKKNAPNSYGQETVANWICEPGCPVARLDEQTCTLKSGWRPNRKPGSLTNPGQKGRIYNTGMGGRLSQTHNDTGGASRFYKQIGGSDE